VVHDGCCDDGTASIVSATRRSPYGWPGLNGSWDTRAIGVKRGSVLAARPRWAGDGVTVPLHVVGVEAYWLVAGKDGGRYAGYVAKEDADVAWAAP
ncbi:hypothetical protein ABLW48_23905, partial [Salmonella enterica]|uniref:hypothetical protein n=1 Tax=Salmonella enterica TaxID=28901 RepID=UPI0032B54E70